MVKDKKKIKIPKSVSDLRLSMKKYAKKHDIKIKGKGLDKKDKKRIAKKLINEYSEFAIEGLNKGVKILAENPDSKKIEKVSDGIENIITNPAVMEKISKLYKKDKKAYPNLKFLPFMIMNTLTYYNSDSIDEADKELKEKLDEELLIKFCESILKKEIERYEDQGLSPEVAFTLASTIPTTSLFENKKWYKTLITTMYDLADKEEVDIDKVLKAVLKVDKKDGIKKRKFLEGFFSELLMTKSSNKHAKFSDTQKELHEGLIERCLTYLDALKEKELKAILKDYIKRRKHAEEHKTDSKRIIKFTDHSNSNSPYEKIKRVVVELIEDNGNNELYLS